MKKYITFILFIFIITGCNTDDNINNDNNDNNLPSNNTPIPTPDKEQKTLIVGINFNNQTLSYTKENYINKIFGTQNGEIKDYYSKTTHNKFNISPVNDSQGSNDGYIEININTDIGTWSDPNNQFIKDTMNLAFTESLNYINLDDLDTNNNNIIEGNELTVIFIVAGNELSYDNTQNIGLWAYSFWFVDNINGNYYYMNHNGFTFKNKYAAFGEKHTSNNDSHLATIGIIVHELGHAIFNLKDLYPTTFDVSNIYNFGLMSGGSWNYTDINGNVEPGNSPFPFTSYHKLKTGLVIPEEINHGFNINNKIMYGSELNSNNILKVNTKLNEYFLVENISNSGYEKGLNARFNFNGGLLISHIKEDANVNNNEPIIEIEYSKLKLEPKYKYDTDYFLWSSSTNSLFDDNSPVGNSKNRDGSNSNLTINNISNSNNEMNIDINFN